MKKPEITKEIFIEDLIKNYVFSINFLSQKGVTCIPCGDPVCGTLEEAAKEKGFDDNVIKKLVEEMKELAANDN